MNREELTELDKDELIAIANEKFGLNADRRFKEDKLVDMILEQHWKGQGNGENTAAEMDEDGMYEVPPGGAVVELQAGPYNPYKRAVPLGVSGKLIYCPVEKPVVLKAKYLEVLRNARRGTVTQTRNPQTGGYEDHWKDSSAYPFSIHYHNKTDKTQKISI